MSSTKWYELKQAIYIGDLKTIEHICREHPDIFKNTDKDGDTLLHLYLGTYSYRTPPTIEIVTCITLQQGASLTSQNKDGNTPFHFYLFQENCTLEIVKVLIQHGASLSLQNKDLNTPLHCYLHYGNCTLEIVKVLIQRDALTLQNKDGNTPLHCYLLRDIFSTPTLEIVKVLIQHGASLTSQNNEGNTPVNILEKNAYISEKEKNKIAIYFDKVLVPAEVYSRGKDAIKIYKDELQNGEIDVVNSRCMFLGKEGAGKSSCVKAMLGKRFNSREPSTDGIVTTTVFQAKKDCRKWKKVKDVDGAELSKKIRAHALAENMDKKLGKESNDTTIVGQLLNFWKKTMRKEKVNVSDITSIWDYAGQLDYYITHRFFLTNKVSYCVTFNVEDNLNELANPRDSTIESLGMTNLDMNLFWVRSIYEHTVLQHGSGNPVFVDDKSIESPPICLVATHMDKLPGTTTEKQIKAEGMFMQMFDAMKGMAYAKHVDCEMYMVDNTVKSHEGIEKLKRNVGRYMKEMVREVPVKWVDLQERLQVIGKTRLSITLAEVSEIATQCNISKHVLTTVITYLNDTGIIMYTSNNEKLRDIVITNLLWMIKILTKVITVVTPTIKVKKAEDRNQLQMLWEKLSNEGVLEKKLLRYLWRNEDEDLFDVFVELMKVFRLLFEKTKGIEEGNRVFLVPCRMKVDKKDILKVKADDTQTVSIYLTPTDFLPDAVYNTLVVAFLEMMIEKGSDDSEVFRNRSDFKFSNHTVSLGSVKINHEKEKPYALKLEISRWTYNLQPIADSGDTETEFKFKPESNICMEVLSYLKKQLENTCTIYEGIGYNLRVLCTACEPSNHHLIDLDKCLKNKLVPCGRKKAMNTAYIKRFFSTGPTKEPVPKPGSVSASDLESELRPVTALESVSLSIFGGSAEKKFQKMLVQVSNWYDEHDSLDMLKVLCKDLITPYNALQKADTTLELFTLLKQAGHLTATNCKVLIDIINVTGTKGVLEANDNLMSTSIRPDESDHLVRTVTTYRQKLIDFGKTLSLDNVRTLIHHLNDVSRKQCDNQWTVILYLEEMGILREDKLQSFIEHLKENKMTVAAETLDLEQRRDRLLSFTDGDVGTASSNSDRLELIVGSTGGTLHLKNENIKLEIYPGAIEEGKKVNISLENVFEETDLPVVSLPLESIISPIVKCGPEGTIFNKPCSLSFPHDAVDEENWEFTLLVKDRIEDEWNQIPLKNGEKNIHFTLSKGRCCITLNHFCWHALMGLVKNVFRVKKIMSLGIFGKMLADDEYQLQTRLYKPSYEKKIEEDHSKIGDQLLQPPVNIRTRYTNMVITVAAVEQKCNVQDKNQTVDAECLWQIDPLNTFILRRSNPSVKVLKVIILLSQESNDIDPVKVNWVVGTAKSYQVSQHYNFLYGNTLYVPPPHSPRAPQGPTTEPVPKPESLPASDLESELKPVTALKSELKPVTALESELKPVTALESEVKPVTLLESDQKPVTPLESELKPVTPLESEVKSVTALESNLKPVKPLESELKPVTLLESELKPVTALESELKPVTPLESELKPVTPLESELKPLTAPESVSLRIFGESPENKCQSMLVQVSNWYDDHDTLDMLKVLCKDLATPYNALQKADTTMELFDLLKQAGRLTATNFKVLIDIINVTGTKGALEANKYLKNAFDKSDQHVTTVTPYRQKLIDFGKTVSQDHLKTLINLKDVSRKQRDNQWTVILFLEERGILREDKLQSFIEYLKENKMTVAAEKLE